MVDYFNDVPSTAAIYLDPDGTPRDVGSTLRNPDLAKTYELIARSGPRAFYSGPVARAMAAAAQKPPIAADANHVWRPGLMTERDLARYDAVWREPTRVGYKGLDVWGMGPPSSGGSSVGEALNILEGMPLSASDRTRSLHYFLEASRYTFADRNKYLGDPDYVDVPLRCLLSDRFAAERRALITEQAVNAAVPGGDCGPPGTVGLAQEGPSTTHLTVADDDGYVVSYTFTIESTGGNGIVVPGYGFLLNNELTDFNYSDLNVPNSVEGGKRPRSSMAPTIITRHGRPVLAVGSPGGSMIITTVLQTLIERLELGKSLPAAIASPRASQRNGATSIAEPAFMSTEAAALTAEHGHAFGTPQNEIGAVTGIEFLDRGRFLAAAEPTRRGGGSAAVVREQLAKSSSTGSRARASSTTASASASCSIGYGPVATAATRTRSARAHAMSRGVSPITTVRSRGQSPARCRAMAGSSAREAWSDAKPPWPGSKKRPSPARSSLRRATGSRLPVTSEIRNSSGRAASASSSSTMPGSTRSDRSAGHSRS